MACHDCPSTITTGAVGLAKAALGVDRASVATIQARRDACRECPHATRNPKRVNRPTKGLTTFSLCRLCDCLIRAKSVVGSEKCPDGRW